MMSKSTIECHKTRLWKSCGRSVHFLCTAGHEKKNGRRRVRQSAGPPGVDVLSRLASLDRGVTLP
jgi:hypothetical protein